MLTINEDNAKNRVRYWINNLFSSLLAEASCKVLYLYFLNVRKSSRETMNSSVLSSLKMMPFFTFYSRLSMWYEKFGCESISSGLFDNTASMVSLNSIGCL